MGKKMRKRLDKQIDAEMAKPFKERDYHKITELERAWYEDKHGPNTYRPPGC